MVLDSGDNFQDMLRELRKISPNRTRAECKLLLRRIKQVQAASQVITRVRFAFISCGYNVAAKLRVCMHSLFNSLVYFLHECL